jgi:5'-AMP-activated protein kinase regulatory beta subunit
MHHCRVAFALEAEQAERVALVGSFNDWDPQRHPMARKGSGPWKKTVLLAPGVYEYKFWIDGQWREDPRNAHTRPNPFGTVNSIVAVSDG